jgi:geranylgeranyl reductase
VPVNPWQTLKLTLLTIGAYLRGQAFAPSGYTPVPSAVRSEQEMDELLAADAAKALAAHGAASSQPAADQAMSRPSAESGEREPILAGKS